jgi:beta-N-acetylhexosaminidase
LIKNLSFHDCPVVVVSFGSPYFYMQFPDVQVYICAYRHVDQAQKAAVQAIFGESPMSGKLPISLPGYFSLGHGLTLTKLSEN